MFFVEDYDSLLTLQEAQQLELRCGPLKEE